ncbi:MAG: copper chaperone PCu(A)C [Henriciella sp.]|uniref:copper chaperone PCu(A)C n=1 Tax=Henriciella sp. TaxID=1968823 RepID=UPI003C773626
MRVVLASLLLAPALIAACQPTSNDASAAQDGPVLSYTDAFIMAPLGGRDVTMGGIEISVTGGDVMLSGVTSEIATTVETHSMSMDNGTMRMRPVEGWQIEDGETLVLERGSDHLMFFGVEEGLAAGDTANVTFYFDVEGREEPLMLEAEADVLALGE